MKADCIDHGRRGNAKGYTLKGLRTPGKRTSCNLHRWVYANFKGVSLDSLEGLVIRHTCDNTRCINPLHLVEGTHQDNMQDKVNRGRTSKGELNGSVVLTAEQVEYVKANCIKGDLEFGQAAMARTPRCAPLNYKFNHAR